MNGESVVLRWIHVWIILALQILAMGAVYGAIKFQIEDHERRIQKLEDSHFMLQPQGVSRDQFDQMKEDLMRRLGRIEAKIDMQQSK